MQKWEYLEVYHWRSGWSDSMGRSGDFVYVDAREIDGRWYHSGGLLNELGAQGWELIGIEVLPAGQYGTTAAKWIFKRPGAQGAGG